MIKENNFYTSYPTGRIGLKGTYECLQPYIAFGYNQHKQNAVDEIIRSSTYFDWNKATIHFQRLQAKNEIAQSAKHILVPYLFECCYDLLLSKNHNVSNNPGYESITGQYSCKKYWLWCVISFLCTASEIVCIFL